MTIQWDDWIFIDTCVEVMADMLTWILGISFVIHYLEEFVTIGPPGSPESNFTIVRLTGNTEVAGPATSLQLLGIVLDTHKVEACFPMDKLTRVQQAAAQWLDRKNVTKRQILLLVGQLRHTSKVVDRGCTFVARMYATAAKVSSIQGLLMVSGLICGGAPLCNTGMGTVSFTWHLKTFGKFSFKLSMGLWGLFKWNLATVEMVR